jgi:hypothetical protein
LGGSIAFTAASRRLRAKRPNQGAADRAGQSATCTGSQNRLGYPISGDVTDYGCRDGDVFLSGTLRGRLTIAAENNITIVANTAAGGT